MAVVIDALSRRTPRPMQLRASGASISPRPTSNAPGQARSSTSGQIQVSSIAEQDRLSRCGNFETYRALAANTSLSSETAQINLSRCCDFETYRALAANTSLSSERARRQLVSSHDPRVHAALTPNPRVTTAPQTVVT